jgi:hypothetical protein
MVLHKFMIQITSHTFFLHDTNDEKQNSTFGLFAQWSATSGNNPTDLPFLKNKI